MDEKELNQVKFDIRKLETMIEVLAKDIQDIKEALLGNEFNQEGLVKKVQSNEKNIAELLKFKQKIVAYATGLSVGSGALVNFLMELTK